MDIEQRPSPADHFEERKNGGTPQFLILHYTETEGMGDADAYFRGTKSHPTGGKVSVHYMVDEDGSVYQYVNEEKRAWHAGVSHWEGVEDINSFSIGVEIVNPGHKYGYRAFPIQQMQAVLELCREIIKRHNIAPHNVLGHSDVAPDRKIDPGELFDWKMLAGRGVGLWPNVLSEDFAKAAHCLHDEAQLRRMLVRYGYNPAHDTKTLVKAFQRHFYPEAFVNGKGVPGEVDQEAAARLCALVRQKKSLQRPAA